MSITYKPITELEAINKMLMAIGEQPVNTIPVTGISEATIAQKMLHNTSREVQGKGLNCNTDSEYTLSPDSNGNIIIPANVLRIDPSDQSKDYVWRNNKLYDKDKNKQTSVFTKTVDVEVIWFYPFEELPPHVRNYITVKAARKLQAESVGSDTLHNFSAKDEYDAKQEMDRWEFNNRYDTLLHGQGVYGIANRRV
jgi:hypothetical protein